jgi:hypothetical protein
MLHHSVSLISHELVFTASKTSRTGTDSTAFSVTFMAKSALKKNTRSYQDDCSLFVQEYGTEAFQLQLVDMDHFHIVSGNSFFRVS